MFIKLQDVLTLALVNALSVYAQSTGLNVTTAQGPVIGSLVSLNVRQFLGVPYATAQRWEAPTSPPSRVTPLNATSFGKSCPQALNTFNVQFYRTAGLDDSTIFVPESEDCLSVNIWAPSVSRKQSTAVLIWIYGGSFQFGSSSLSWYNGKHIVEDNDDITVVSLNYRLNIFNSPYAPQLISNTTAPQNFGLLDIDAAIRWVHGNIAVFGGDPNRITLFGQSAGAAAVDLYTFAHPSDTIVKGVIEQSGTVSVVETAFATLGPTGWNEVASLVGCGIVNDADQLECMRRIPSKQLEDAVISTDTAFSPTPDGITVFEDTAARAAAGSFLRVPLLGGSTENEYDIFIIAEDEVLGEIVIPAVADTLAGPETLTVFTCPAGATAQQRINAKVPTWRYQYQGIFSDISIQPGLRAYHTAEIPVLFGTFPSPSNTEKALSKFMQSAWVAFARDPSQGLSNIGWPAYSSTTKTLAQIGGPSNKTGTSFSEGRVVDASCVL